MRRAAVLWIFAALFACRSTGPATHELAPLPEALREPRLVFSRQPASVWVAFEPGEAFPDSVPARRSPCELTTVRWPNEDSQPRVVDELVKLWEGTTLEPLLSQGLISAQSMRWSADEVRRLAAVVDFPQYGRSALTIHEQDGRIVHYEVFRWSCEAVGVASLETEGEVVLLDCGSRLLLGGAPIPTQLLALRMREERFGVDSPHLVQELRALIWAYNEEDRVADALREAKRAVALTEACCPGLRGVLLSSLGMIQVSMERYDEAVATLERAMSLVEGEPSEESDVLYSLGLVAQEQRRWAEAARYYEESLALVPAHPGGRDANAARAAHNLAAVYASLGRWADAERQVRLAIENDRNAFGPDHPEVAISERLLERILAARPGPGAPAAPEP